MHATSLSLFRRGLCLLVKSGLCLSLVTCGGGGGSGDSSNGSGSGSGSSSLVTLINAVLPGGGGGASPGPAPVPVIPALVGTVSLIAGNTGGIGSTDGTGVFARFNAPNDIAIDGLGNAYVADTTNHTIRKIDSAGVVTTLAGTAGSRAGTDGTGSAARFAIPNGVAVDAAGNVFVADTGNHKIRKIDSAGVVTTVAGDGVAGKIDGTGAGARFFAPRRLVADTAGNLFVADEANNAIRKVTSAGVVTTLAGAPQFSGPVGITIDRSGNLYVADSRNHTIRKITQAGVVTTFAGSGASGSADGIGTAATFNFPNGITADASDNLYVTDSSNQTIRKITPAGVVTTLLGSAGNQGSADGTGAAASFSLPKGIAVDAAGNLYIADSGNNTIRKSTAATVVTTLAGAAKKIGNTDGTGAAATFNLPFDVATDGSGNMYVADTSNKMIRKITPAGVVTTLAGSGGAAGNVDGTGTAARFNFPYGLHADAAGNVTVADTLNHTIRQITPAGVVTRFAGTAGSAGSTDATGLAAQFNNPRDVVADGAGNLYVADENNHTIRKIDSAGVVTTFAGTAGSAGGADGTGPAATFNKPFGLSIDGAGNLYVGDSNNHTIRKITPAAVVSTLAGTAGSTGSADGTGAAARFNTPSRVAADSSGNVFVADSGNHTIRMITPAGVVTTVAGVAGIKGIRMGSAPSGLSTPNGVVVIGPNTLAVTSENSVLKIVLH